MSIHRGNQPSTSNFGPMTNTNFSMGNKQNKFITTSLGAEDGTKYTKPKLSKKKANYQTSNI